MSSNEALATAQLMQLNCTISLNCIVLSFQGLYKLKWYKAELLLSNRHMSFPVVDDKGFCGVINRIDLTNLLQYPEVFRKRTDPPPDELIKYHSIHTDKDRFDNLKSIRYEGLKLQTLYNILYIIRAICFPGFSNHQRFQKRKMISYMPLKIQTKTCSYIFYLILIDPLLVSCLLKE